MSNVIANQGAALCKGIKPYRRYSNYDLDSSGTEGKTPASSSSGTGGGSSIEWGGVLESLFTNASSALSSIFGRNYSYQSEAAQYMYKQEKRTNAILWVVIGLVVALAVFLVIRKTK